MTSMTCVCTCVCRLFLVSDILHNSTAPVRNASRYRGRFEQVLPGIFESLQEAYRCVALVYGNAGFHEIRCQRVMTAERSCV